MTVLLLRGFAVTAFVVGAVVIVVAIAKERKKKRKKEKKKKRKKESKKEGNKFVCVVFALLFFWLVVGFHVLKLLLIRSRT